MLPTEAGSIILKNRDWKSKLEHKAYENLGPAVSIFMQIGIGGNEIQFFGWSWSVGDRFLAAGSALASVFCTLQGAIHGAQIEHGWQQMLFLRPSGWQKHDMFDVNY